MRLKNKLKDFVINAEKKYLVAGLVLFMLSITSLLYASFSASAQDSVYEITVKPGDGYLDGIRAEKIFNITSGSQDYNEIEPSYGQNLIFNGYYTMINGKEVKVYDSNGKYVSENGIWDSDGKYIYNNNLTVLAKYSTGSGSSDKYYLTINMNGGKYLYSSTETRMYELMKKTKKNNSLQPATKDGYKFLGYYTDKGIKVYDENGVFVSGKGIWDSDGKFMYDDYLIVTAKFEPISHKLIVNTNTYDRNGYFNGQIPSNGKVILDVCEGETDWNSISPAYFEGYKFKGYYTKYENYTDADKVYDENGNFVPGSNFWDNNGNWIYTSDLNIYAIYEPSSSSYKITLDLNGGTINYDSRNRIFGVVHLSKLNNKLPVPQSYSDNYLHDFKGYYIGNLQVYDQNGNFVPETAFWYIDGDWIYEGNVTLKAKYEKSTTSETPGYKVTLQYNDTNEKNITTFSTMIIYITYKSIILLIIK